MLTRLTEKTIPALAERIRLLLEKLEGDERVRRGIFLGLLALIGAVMLLLNAHTPLQMDDYDYSFSWSTGERIAGLTDVIASQAAHYSLWGGRSIVHALAQIFLAMDKRVFNIANTAMYLLFLLEMYTLARPKGRRFCWPLLLGAHMALFSGVPFFGTVFLWLTGSCNYLWGTALALTPLLVLKSGQEGGFFARKGCGWLALPVCFAAGWTNENTACGVLAIVLLILVGLRMQQKRVPAWQWAALCAQGLGVLVMLAAPGNYARASSYEYGSMLFELLRRFAAATAYGVVYVGALLVAALLAGALGRALGVKMRAGRALLLLLCGALMAYAMVASPVFSDRSWTGVIAAALCAVLLLAGDIDEQVRALDAAKLLALPVLALLVAYGGYQALGEVKAHEDAWQAQTAAIEEAAARGMESVSVSGVESHSRFTMDILVETDAAAWPNSTLSKAFGISVNGR